MRDQGLRWISEIYAGLTPRWLSLLGPSGTGKSFLAGCLWRALRRMGKVDNDTVLYSPLVVYWPMFVEEMRDPNSCALYQWRDMRQWPVLILDDIGAERDTTGFAREKLNTLLGCRDRRWTMLTSNQGMDSLSERETRIASRMIRDGSIVVENNAPDWSTR